MMDSVKPTQHRERRTPILATLAIALLIAGCTGVMPPIAETDRTQPPARASADNAALEAFLEEAMPGTTRRFEQSPWGDAVTLRAGERYYAASGRTCRRLSIEQATDGETRMTLACRDTQGWEPVPTLMR